MLIGPVIHSRTVGWQPTCECHGKLVKRKIKVVGQMPCKENAGDDLATLRLSNRDADRRRQLSGKLGEWKNKEHTDDELIIKTVLEYVPSIPLDKHPVRPCIVLDPFCGSGTTAMVAMRYGRWSWGIDLSETYLKENAIPRIQRRKLRRSRKEPGRTLAEMDSVEDIVRRCKGD